MWYLCITFLLFPSIITAHMNIIEEGDILNLPMVPGMQDSALANKQWPHGVVNYRVSPGFSSNEIDQIKGAIAEIEQKTCIRFRNENLGSHINFIPSNRCASFVGNLGHPFGQQLYLGPGCFSRRTILHELMHALGFIHEHTRPDRDDYLIVYSSNIQPEARHNFKKRDFLEMTLMDSKYAYDSIMHYRERDFAINPWFAVLQAKRSFRGVMGGGNQLSKVDVDRINAYYRCSTTATTTSKPGATIKHQNVAIGATTKTIPIRAICSPTSGFRSDPSDCFRYLECVHGRYMSRPCAPGTSFHTDRGLCGFVDMAKCG